MAEDAAHCDGQGLTRASHGEGSAQGSVAQEAANQQCRGEGVTASVHWSIQTARGCGRGKKKCTKNSSDRVKNESKVKHSSICQNKITASPLKTHSSARTFLSAITGTFVFLEISGWVKFATQHWTDLKGNHGRSTNNQIYQGHLGVAVSRLATQQTLMEAFTAALLSRWMDSKNPDQDKLCPVPLRSWFKEEERWCC